MKGKVADPEYFSGLKYLIGLGLWANIASLYLPIYEDFYLDVETISSKLKDCTIKTNWSNYFIGITIDVFTSYASLYNLTMFNYSIFNFTS